MNASGIKDLHYIRKLSEIILKLLEPFADCSLKEFSNMTSVLNPWLLEHSSGYSYIIWQKLYERVLINLHFSAIYKFDDKSDCSQPIMMKQFFSTI